MMTTTMMFALLLSFHFLFVSTSAVDQGSEGGGGGANSGSLTASHNYSDAASVSHHNNNNNATLLTTTTTTTAASDAVPVQATMLSTTNLTSAVVRPADEEIAAEEEEEEKANTNSNGGRQVPTTTTTTIAPALLIESMEGGGTSRRRRVSMPVMQTATTTSSFVEIPTNEAWWRLGHDRSEADTVGRTFTFEVEDPSVGIHRQLPPGRSYRLRQVRPDNLAPVRDCIGAAVQSRLRVGYAPKPVYVTLSIRESPMGSPNTTMQGSSGTVKDELYVLTAESELSPRRLRTRPLPPGMTTPKAHSPLRFSLNYPSSCGYIAEGDPCPSSSVNDITFKMDTVTVHLNKNEYTDYMGGDNPVHVYEPKDVTSNTVSLLRDHLYNFERALFSTFWQSTNKQTGYYAYTPKQWVTWFLANELLGAMRSYDRMMEFRVDADAAADATTKKRRDRGGPPKPGEAAAEANTERWALRISPSFYHHDALQERNSDRWMYRVHIEDSSWAGGRTTSRVPRWFARMFGDSYYLKNVRKAWEGARENVLNEDGIRRIVRMCSPPSTLSTGARVQAKSAYDAELARIEQYLVRRASWMDKSLEGPTVTKGRTRGRTFLFEAGRSNADAIRRDDESDTPSRNSRGGGLFPAAASNLPFF
ncbi:hypothetical protein RI054_05g30530 [Pseudoscourfieldia marina]